MVSVYAPTRMSEFVMKSFYVHLQNWWNCVQSGKTLIVLDDFNATTGTVGMVMGHVLIFVALDREMKTHFRSQVLRNWRFRITEYQNGSHWLHQNKVQVA